MSAATLEISCKTCGATLRVEGHERTARCPYCASSSVVERPAEDGRPEPRFVLGFVLDAQRAEARIQDWLSRRGFFHDAKFRRAAVSNLRGVYVPAYLFSARAESRYRAEIGENYTTTETYTTRDSKGNTVTRTRTVTHTEWRTLEGPFECWILDHVVTASQGVRNEELESVEPFDLRAVRRYQPAILSGWYAEDPTLDLEHCRELAEQEAAHWLEGRLERFLPGDSHRGLEHWTRWHDSTLDLVLLPVWVAAVRAEEDGSMLRLLVNGQTGKVSGKVPLSVAKITLVVVLVLALVTAFVLLLASLGGR